jgi:hypothetical protein
MIVSPLFPIVNRFPSHEKVNNYRMATFPIETGSLRSWDVPIAPLWNKRHFIDVLMLRRWKSFICERANILGPPSARYSSGALNLPQFFWEMGNDRSVWSSQGTPAENLKGCGRSHYRKPREDLRSSMRELAYEREQCATETAFTTTILSLSSHFSLMARNWGGDFVKGNFSDMMDCRLYLLMSPRWPKA